jgi:hypothetical protein
LKRDDEDHWWKEWDINVADIDASRYTNERYPSANHAWIVDFMVTRILPDLSRESYAHIAQKVLNLQGISELSEVLVQAQKQDIVFIRTLNPDGSSYMPQNMHGFNLSETASLYKVGPGSILEHAYLEHQEAAPEDPRFEMAFNFNAIDAPRAISRWVVLVADEAKDKLKFTRVRPELLDEQILAGPKGYTVYQWTNKRIEGIKGERFMPRDGDKEVIPIVQIETPNPPVRASSYMMRHFKAWLPAAAVEKAQRLAALSRQLHPGQPAEGDAEAFKSIVLWTRDHIDTAAESRTLNDVWTLKRGTAQQAMGLAREMAQAAGLRVNMAWLNALYLPGLAWRPKNADPYWEPQTLASFGSGGEMLVYEPDAGPDIWAHFPSDPRQPLRIKFHSPFDMQAWQPRALALILDDDGVRMKRVQGEALGLVSAKQRTVARLTEKGGAEIAVKLQFFGTQAGKIREALADPAQKEKLTEGIVRNSWAALSLKRCDIFGESDPALPLVFSYVGTLTKLGDPTGGVLHVHPFSDAPRVLQLRGSSSRESDLIIRDEGTVSEFDRTAEYVAPDGFAWTEVPDDLFLCTEFGCFSADYNVIGGRLTCARSCLIPMQRITPEKYPEFLKFLAAIGTHSQQRAACSKYDQASFGGRARAIFSGGYSSDGR